MGGGWVGWGGALVVERTLSISGKRFQMRLQAAKIGIDLTAQQVVDKEMKPVAPSSHPEPLDTHEAHHLAALAKLLDYYYSISNQLFDLG